MELILFTNKILWQWILPCLLTITAVICCFRLHGEPLRHFGGLLRDTYGSIMRRNTSADQRRIFASALAATMGTGNLVGTALALIAGGAGAVFWMWVSAALGIFLVYAENRLAGKFRGGTLGYLRHGLHSPLAAALFAFFCTVSALGMGTAVQSNTIAETCTQFGISPTVSGILLTLLLAVILIGGKQRIGNAAVCIMPLICGGYLLGCLLLIAKHAALLPNAFAEILSGAFGFRAVGGGITASVFLQSMTVGIRRGIFSNEAGLGSSAMFHSDGEAQTQEKWAAAEVFADTVVCCTATALAILTVPDLHIEQYTNGSLLLTDAFFSGFGGAAGVFVACAMILFAFATMLGWFSCGCASAEYLFGKGSKPFYTACCLVAAFAGAHGNPAWLWAFCDLCNGCMALPNLYALLLLRPTESPRQLKKLPH